MEVFIQLLITALAYMAYPLIFAFSTERVWDKKGVQKRVIIGTVIVKIIFLVVQSSSIGTISSIAPTIIWGTTAIFAAQKIVDKRNLLSDGENYKAGKQDYSKPQYNTTNTSQANTTNTNKAGSAEVIKTVPDNYGNHIIKGSVPANTEEKTGGKDMVAELQTKGDVLFHDDKKYAQGNLPVIISDVILKKINENDVALSFSFMPTSKDRLCAMMFDVKCNSIWGEELRGIENMELADLKVNSNILVETPKDYILPDAKARRANITIQKIALASGEVMERTAPVTELEELTGVFDNKGPEQGVNLNGKKVVYPEIVNDYIIRCPECKTAQSNSRVSCSKCGIDFMSIVPGAAAEEPEDSSGTKWGINPRGLRAAYPTMLDAKNVKCPECGGTQPSGRRVCWRCGVPFMYTEE